MVAALNLEMPYLYLFSREPEYEMGLDEFHGTYYLVDFYSCISLGRVPYLLMIESLFAFLVSFVPFPAS